MSWAPTCPACGQPAISDVVIYDGRTAVYPNAKSAADAVSARVAS
jgi:hypothetical protein